MIKLNKISDIKTGIVLNRKKADMSKERKFYYGVVSLKSFNENAVYDSSYADEFVSNELIKDEHLVKKGDILLRLREPNFAVYIDKNYENLIYSSLIVRISIKDSKFDPHFIACYLNSNAVKKSLASGLSGTAIVMTKISDINDIKVPLINLEKQKKIVKYLNLARKESELLQNLITAKQKHAKSVFETMIKKG